jgi:hypothetical protein
VQGLDCPGGAPPVGGRGRGQAVRPIMAGVTNLG